MGIRITVAAMLILAAGGCSSSPTIPRWQKSVDRYVADRRDPAALRDVTLPDGRRGFALIGKPDPAESTDANGLLLGHKVIDGQPWFVYLVGLVKRQKVEDIRLAAVTFAGAEPRWIVGGNDSRATSAYRKQNELLWTSSHGEKDKPPPTYTSFPREADRFELVVNGRNIEASDPASGARWRIDLAGAER